MITPCKVSMVRSNTSVAMKCSVEDVILMIHLDVVVLLETNLPERRSYRRDLMDDPWPRADRFFRRPFNIAVTFARTDKPHHTDAGPGRRAVQLASAKRGRIAILPLAYQDPKYSRLIRDIEPYPGLDVDELLNCITASLIHQKSHAMTRSKCICAGGPQKFISHSHLSFAQGVKPALTA